MTAIAAIVALVVAACGSSSDPVDSSGESTQPSADAGTETTLTVWINGTEKEQGTEFKEFIPAFEAANPGVKIELELLDWATANQKILTAAAGSGLPDVLEFYNVDGPSFASTGVLHPLDDLLDKDVYLPNAVDLASWEGKWYAAPWILTSRLVNIRKDLAADAGLPVDTPPETWTELQEWAEKLAVRDGNRLTRVGFWVPTDHPYKTIQQYIPFLWSNGGRFFSTDGCTAAFDSTEGVETAELLSGFLNDSKVDFPGSVETDNIDFGQGKVGIITSNIAVRSWATDFPELDPAEDVLYIPMPHNEGKQSYVEVGGNFLAVSKTSKNAELAAKFIEYLTTDEDAVVRNASLERNVLPLVTGKDSEYTKSNPTVSQLASIIEQYGAGIPKHPEWPKMASVVTTALSSIYLNNADAAETLKAAAAEVNDVLSKSGVCAEEAPNLP